ncbi:MAG TPA: 6-bladed beta-propeller [Caldithrix abyssi]|uniref:6-bladed beta-propeller n=1 Tax=Caldithrix abyssi TaxID=187145 RepID=A0A7V4TZA6_CALAY|nr:6-bladed beta-propeller [Caldithrix abyssi]
MKKQTLLFLLFYSLVGHIALYGQEKSFAIKWIGEYSSTKDLKKEESLSGKVYNFIFGEEIKKIIRPISLFTANGSEFWIVDQGSRKIVHIDTVDGKFEYFHSEKNPFYSPLGICEFTENRLLISDSQLDKILVFNTVTGVFYNLNDTLRLQRPTGIAFNKVTGQIWVAETAKHRLLVLDSDGKIVKMFGKRGLGAGEFNFPTFIWIDKSGTVYVVDSMNFRIQILNAEGRVQNVFGEIGDASGYFSRPKGIATDSEGHIYVADALFHAVQIFNQEGDLLYYFGTQGKGPGQFWLPTGLFIDEKDRIYVADSYNSRIQIFKLIKKE